MTTKKNSKKSQRVKKAKIISSKKRKKREVVVALPKKKERKEKEYIYTIGRRKTSVAQIRFYKKGKGMILINDKDLEKYFPYFEFQSLVKAPLALVGVDNFDLTIKVNGGGTRGQAEAIRHGIARALALYNPNFKKPLRTAGFLTRDPRKKERKKYGLKGARRAPQWQKR